MKIKPLPLILIIMGVLIIAYPIADRIYSRLIEQKLMREWEERMRNQQNDADYGESDAVSSYLNLDEVFSQLSEEEEQSEKTENTPTQNFVTLGVLKIDKIKLSIPVLEGCTRDVLRVGAGTLDGASKIGEIGGNTGISAHRSYTYGKQFNRLNELEEGDTFNITTQQAVYHYEVFNIQIVEPTDVSLLKKNREESVVSLITCHPIYIASHRLIVQGRLIEAQPIEQEISARRYLYEVGLG
jgi:sortase A